MDTGSRFRQLMIKLESENFRLASETKQREILAEAEDLLHPRHMLTHPLKMQLQAAISKVTNDAKS